MRASRTPAARRERIPVRAAPVERRLGCAHRVTGPLARPRRPPRAEGTPDPLERLVVVRRISDVEIGVQLDVGLLQELHDSLGSTVLRPSFRLKAEATSGEE